MDPIVENEAKLHITNGIEKASGATGVDIKVSHPFKHQTISETVTDLTELIFNCV